ncbi:type VI secretion system lipoprotein TssJ [Utexia brackfieldae]|uniref:type VI secretion system lipoprotein TssJ n=1 Tax=Utexia brackfieldae TaxID=3074108 RepID=UPI00370D984A
MRLGGVLLLIFCTLLGGCETTKKLYQVITDPSVPVGYPDNNPTEITLTLLADNDINPNYNGEATPTDIQLVFLNEDSKLFSTDYYQIATEPLDKILAKNYIDHQDYTVEPGEYKTLKPIPVDPKTQFIAVIAHFAGADSGQAYWLDITEIEGVGKTYNLLIHVRASEVEIKKS